jgi:hypothetical protein
MKKYISLVIMMVTALAASAQGVSASNNSIMTRDLKIYTAIAVLAIVLSCIFIFLFYIEKRLTQLEAGQKR